MELYTESLPLALVRATASTATSFAALAPTTTKPSGDGVVPIGKTSATSRTFLLLLPIGTDAANETYDMRVSGWGVIGTLWVPRHLVTVSVTLGTQVGVAGTNVTDSTYFADTITYSKGDEATRISSPADNTIAWVRVDMQGCSLAKVEFDSTGSATANALYHTF